MSDLFTDDGAGTLERAMCEFLRHPVARNLRTPEATLEAKIAMANALAAVAPAMRARWLRELAETPHIHPLTREWLLSMAEAEER